LYLLAAVVLVSITDFSIVHYRRLSALKVQDDYFSGANLNVAFNYWNYYRRLNPGSAEPHFYLGLIDIKRGRIDQGMAEYTRAIESDPGLAEAYVNRGSI